MPTCDNCHKEAVHIVINADGESCENCGHLDTTGGHSMDGAAARNIYSIRESQKIDEGDLIQPWVVGDDGQQTINDDFIDLYPDQAHQYYTEEELKAKGLHKLAEKTAVDRENAKRGVDDSDAQSQGELDEAALQQFIDEGGENGK